MRWRKFHPLQQQGYVDHDRYGEQDPWGQHHVHEPYQAHPHQGQESNRLQKQVESVSL